MLNRKNMLVILLVFSQLKIFATYIQTHAGARSAGMANTSVTLADIWSTHNNQAGLAFIQSRSFACFSYNRFLIKDLTSNSLAFAQPLKYGVLAISLDYMGFDGYRQNKYGIAFAKKFGETLAIGMQADYHQLQLNTEYGKNGNLTIQSGIISKLSQKLTLGAHWYKPIRENFNKNSYLKFPTIMKLGINYSFNKQVNITIQTQKASSEQAKLNLGIEYVVNEKIHLRTGIDARNKTNTLGIGLKLTQLTIDVAASRHPTLGFSPNISLAYSFK